MHASSHIIWKKISASLILALFLFIHAEKVFHKHQKEADHTQQRAIAVRPINATCAICDFQISKDSELPPLISTTITSVCLVKEYAGASAFYHYLPATRISNRGPPVA